MRENHWKEQDAEIWRSNHTNEADRLLAERVYSSRLIGKDPDLVMHGGGNTSVKVQRPDLFGNMIDVLHVKGSGWDLDTLEAPGLPGVRMTPLMALRSLPALSDEDMVNIQRANLIDTSGPNPSVETLLHAYLPHRFVDHTHATAFLALANLPNATEAVEEIFGDRLICVPYIMPGFALAKAAADIFETRPDCEGLVLLKHGHFTFGETARDSYDNIIAHTNAVEDYLAHKANGRRFTCTVGRQHRMSSQALALLPPLRGSIARKRGTHHGTEPVPCVTDLRTSPIIDAFLERDDLHALSKRGVGSPDHVIRTKGHMLVLEGTENSAALDAAIDQYAKAYQEMFARQNNRVGGHKIMLEPLPGIAWIKGLGLIGIGKDASAAAAAADIAEQTAEVITLAEPAGGFHPIGEEDLFDMEYWSLEQAKLAKSKAKSFTGQIVAVTGGAGAIGQAIAKAFAKEGAAIALIDKNQSACTEAAKAIGPTALAVTADLTNSGAAAAIMEQIASRFGGLDILVSNAGYALQGQMTDLDEGAFRASFEVNFFAHKAMALAAADLFAAQGHGGQILFNVSKQAVNPGKGFGAYGLPKATTFFLLRQLALELGPKHIRVNGVNADRIRSGLLTDEFIASRADARGVSQEDYMAGNLLRKEVEAHHVADAFVALAKAERTTAHVMTVDGGNIEAALR